MTRPAVSGVAPGQRQLNGPQTTGRTYRNLSEPTLSATVDDDVPVPMRDGINLLADVHRPLQPGRYPVLIAASPYPRQIQNLGAPAGFIEAGQSDFFVPRGYVHVIANIRGTSGSEGTYGFSDVQERQDMHDLVEWAAAQPWSDGNVGMIGISYFAGTQMAAAVEQPPHLKAIMPIAGTYDFYESSTHHGLMSSGFITPFLSMIGMTSKQGNKLWRGRLLAALRELLLTPGIHRKFEEANGEAAIAGLKILLKLRHDPHPWDDIWRAIAVEHPLRDQWWEDRNLLPHLHKVTVPVYIGCAWDNVPLHLPHTFKALDGLTNSKHVQMAMLGTHGLSWPWESLHVEALAWFDHWLKGNDTGILEGPRVRYVLRGVDTWRTADNWPPPEARHLSLALRADGALSEDEGATGERTYMNLGVGLNRPFTSESDPPGLLTWTMTPGRDLDIAGDIELQLDATSTATDTAFIAILQDVAADGKITDITGGYLRAGLRKVDEEASRPGAPVLPCKTFDPLTPGELTHYRIPLVPNAHRLKAGHTLRLTLTSEDQGKEKPALLEFRHASVSTSCNNTIRSNSRLLLPVI